MKPQLSIEAFADWCEKQPADAEYNYVDSDNCACSQYAAFLGMPERYGLPSWRVAFYDGSPFWNQADDLASYWPFTFRALASRLRAQA